MKSTVLNELIDILNNLKIESTNPNCITKRTGEYRIGLSDAITEANNLMYKEEKQIINMINVRVYIEDEIDFLDDDVSVSFKLPAIPRVGERIFLSNELISQLENMAISSLDKASNYRNWFYGYSHYIRNGHDIKENNLKDLSFGDASYVTNVVFIPDDDTVYIELGSS